MTTIVIVGRPNVGKSSLFNVLTKKRDALVADVPGLTRDRHYSKILINDYYFGLIDTGGLEQDIVSEISKKMAEQTLWAVDESDIILFVVDGKEGLTKSDQSIAKEIRKKNKPIALIINKSEGKSDNLLIAEFSCLGFKNMMCISASHRDGIDEIHKFIIQFAVKSLPQDEPDNKKIKLSILGKPNVGKSTLVNSIIGEDRMICQNLPGTTRDSISINFNLNGNLIELTDTAGIRKKGKVSDVIEKFSILKSLMNIDISDVCILLIDALSGFTVQDLQIFGYIKESGKPLVIAINKWDMVDSYQKEILKNEIDKRIGILNNFDILQISALKKIGLKRLLTAVLSSYKSSRIKMPTSVVNNLLKELQISHQPPIVKGIRPKLKFAHQGDIVPPTIIIHGNHLSEVRKDYIKYLESSLIKFFKIRGTNIRIQLKESENPFDVGEKKVRKTGLVTRRRQINAKREKLKKMK